MRTLARECAFMCACTRVDVCIYGCTQAKPIMPSLARECACMCACPRVDLCSYGCTQICSSVSLPLVSLQIHTCLTSWSCCQGGLTLGNHEHAFSGSLRDAPRPIVCNPPAIKKFDFSFCTSVIFITEFPLGGKKKNNSQKRSPRTPLPEAPCNVDPTPRPPQFCLVCRGPQH